MKKIQSALIIFTLLNLITACNTNPLINNGGSDIKQVQKIANNIISGIVEFPVIKEKQELTTKANLDDVKVSTTVSIIDPVTKITIATGLTDSNGAFSINPGGGFAPNDGDVFILEGVKRINKDLLSVRTYIKKSPGGWDSITSPIIKINVMTTALSVIASLRNIPPSGLIDRIEDVDTSSGNYTEFTNASTKHLNQVINLVNIVFSNNRDPITSISFDGFGYNIDNKNYIVSPLTNFILIRETGSDPFGGIATIRLDGTNYNRIYGTEGSIQWMTLLEDGNTLIFKRNDHDLNQNSNNDNLYSMKLDGSTGVNLVTNNSFLGSGNSFYNYYNASSPDGNKLVTTVEYTGGPFSHGIYYFDKNNVNGINFITTNSITSIEPPQWSENSTAFTYNYKNTSTDLRESYLVKLNDLNTPVSVTEQLDPADNIVQYTPRISPDGNKVMFITYSINTDNYKLYIVTVNNGAISDSRVIDTSTNFENYEFSPNSEKIVYSKQQTFDGGISYPNDLYSANVDGTDIKNLTNNFVESSYFYFSPAGTRFVFSRDSSKVTFNYYDGARLSPYIAQVGVENSEVSLDDNLGINLDAFDISRFSKNSDRIIYPKRISSTVVDYYYKNADGTGTPQKITDSSKGFNLKSDTSLHPTDEKFLLNAGTELWVMNNDGTGLAKFNNVNINDLRKPFDNELYVPKWVNNGTQISLVVTQNFQKKIKLFNSDGSDATTFSSSFDYGKEQILYLK